MPRLLSLIAIVLLVFVASKAMVRALPGDPIETLIAETGTAIPAEELRRDLELDQAFIPGLFSHAFKALQGDFGRSLFSRKPIGPLIAESVGRTAALTGLALTLGLLFSVWLGCVACLSPWMDRLCSFHGAAAASLPSPWIGPVLIYFLAVELPLFPIGDDIFLPAITLAFGFSGFWSRLIRERVRETLRLGAAMGARARGVAEWKVLLKYGLMPASGSLLAYLGTQIGALMAGAFVIEVIFDWPGMGALLVESVLRRDYPVVEAAVFVGAVFALLGTFAGDALQGLVDPRVHRRSEGA